MQRILCLLLILFSVNSYAEGSDIIYETFTPAEVNILYSTKSNLSFKNLPNLIDREEKIGQCVIEYLDKQAKTYARGVQDNLYDLLHNLNKIQSKIYGHKYTEDERVSRDEKLRALAEVQCEAYFEIGILK